jgi:hypothetical protein
MRAALATRQSLPSSRGEQVRRPSAPGTASAHHAARRARGRLADPLGPARRGRRFGKALGYLRGLWLGLTRFLDDPRIPLDNNRTERGLRGVVLGRKNHYGSRSHRGLDVAALFYSLIESAKVCGVEPKAYLRHAMRAALADRASVTLPHTLLT